MCAFHLNVAAAPSSPNQPCAADMGAKEPFAHRISTTRTLRDPIVVASTMLPRGSAIITSSGAMRSQGIVGIIHAASGAMTRQDSPFQPTLESVAAVVENSMHLAKLNGFQKIAMPFIGGSSFADRIGVALPVLAETLVQAAMDNKDGVEVVFVAFGAHDSELLSVTCQKLGAPFTVVSGSITQFSLHRCPIIVNAANMEGVIGGGVAYAIGSASGNIGELDREALEIRAAFYGLPAAQAKNYSSAFSVAGVGEAVRGFFKR